MSACLALSNLPRSLSLEKDNNGNPFLIILDERKLPQEKAFIRTQDWKEVVRAIKVLAVRGAPAIGVAGASALLLWAWDPMAQWSDLHEVSESIANARPTAVNLRWAVERACLALEKLAAASSTSEKDVLALELKEGLFDFVMTLFEEDEKTNRAIGENGASLFSRPVNILTHCNAGSLATTFYGTALGVVYAAAEQGNIAHVYADETRPVGQGARLTSWELAQANVPVTLICDNMAASLMAKGNVDAVIVGADRIARNGDTANKIGTYGVAVLARHHGIPFYIAAPFSTIDSTLEDGSLIPIEERDQREILPDPIEGVGVWNPAFDVTPSELITAIITERGVFTPRELAVLLASENN